MIHSWAIGRIQGEFRFCGQGESTVDSLSPQISCTIRGMGCKPHIGGKTRRRTSPRHPPRAGRGSAGLFRACVFLFYQLNPRPSERAGRAEQDPPVSLAHPRPPAADVKKICKTKTAVARPKGTRRQFLRRGEQLCMKPHERKADHGPRMSAI